MLNTGFDHARPYVADSVLDMVRAAAEAHGSGIAVRCGASEITYADLMAAAEINAALLKERGVGRTDICLLYTSPSPRDRQKSRMPSSA